VFFEESPALNVNIVKLNADILVMGDDWQVKFGEFNDIFKVVYLPRTPSISSIELTEILKDR
jgi:glycerol-3-phosphate cytidylyltransferase-like family protein